MPQWRSDSVGKMTGPREAWESWKDEKAGQWPLETRCANVGMFLVAGPGDPAVV